MGVGVVGGAVLIDVDAVAADGVGVPVVAGDPGAGEVAEADEEVVGAVIVEGAVEIEIDPLVCCEGDRSAVVDFDHVGRMDEAAEGGGGGVGQVDFEGALLGDGLRHDGERSDLFAAADFGRRVDLLGQAVVVGAVAREVVAGGGGVADGDGVEERGVCDEASGQAGREGDAVP